MSIKSLAQWIQAHPGGAVDHSLILDHLEAMAVIDDYTLQKQLLKDLVKGYASLEKRLDSLLKNTLPADVADEIRHDGRYPPRPFDCTILFTDFVGFTRIAETMSQVSLIETLHEIFSEFDRLVDLFGGVKIKTIGDAYMAVFGAPAPCPDHAVRAVKTALAMVQGISGFQGAGQPGFRMRVGVHTGAVMAGVVGMERMQFDVFGDNVNVAARFESSGEENRVNVSESTYNAAKDAFVFQERGLIPLKNKAPMKAFFVVREK